MHAGHNGFIMTKYPSGTETAIFSLCSAFWFLFLASLWFLNSSGSRGIQSVPGLAVGPSLRRYVRSFVRSSARPSFQPSVRRFVFFRQSVRLSSVYRSVRPSSGRLSRLRARLGGGGFSPPRGLIQRVSPPPPLPSAARRTCWSSVRADGHAETGSVCV